MDSHYHFIGIAGIGMSGLARLLLQQGVSVSGSDPATSPLKRELRDLGALIFDSQEEENINPSYTVIYSSDIAADNPELVAAKRLGCCSLHRSLFLAEFAASFPYSLAVSGTHGKTTTTALLTAILTAAGFSPSFAVGGLILPSRINSGRGEGDYFVFEADESDGTMVNYHPYGAILTNIDSDHMNHYGSLDALDAAFQTFAAKLLAPEFLVWCGDDGRLCDLKLPGTSYGYGSHCQFVISRVRQEGWHTLFDLSGGGYHIPDLSCRVPGRHLAANAAAAAVMALQLGIGVEEIRQGLVAYEGVCRRLERLGSSDGSVMVIDDYAHHPTEIAATLEAVRSAVGERRLLAVYQPHRYSRMAHLSLEAFAKVFDTADELLITDLYSAGEKPIAGVGSQELVELLQSEGKSVHYCSRQELFEELIAKILPHDVVVVMGAGDVTKVAHSLAEALNGSPPRRLRVGVTFGGPSPEHEISLRSAQFVINNLDPKIYDVELFGVSRAGKWITEPQAAEMLAAEGSFSDTIRSERLSANTLAALEQCDLFFPIMHGPYGEDGIVQGFFEVLGKPYIGCRHHSAAICMNKVVCKKIVSYHGLSTAPFVHFSARRWRGEREEILRAIDTALSFPLIIKPAHIGSSAGLGIAYNNGGLIAAIDEACLADDEVIVEKRLYARDIEFAVLGGDRVLVLPPGEILTGGKPYDYRDKFGSEGPATTPIAELPAEWVERGVEAAHIAYNACHCSGLARIDFLLDDQGTFWFGEVNPIPGMTPMSLYPQMCQQYGIGGVELMDSLIIHALASHRESHKKACYKPSLQPVE